MKMKLLVNLMVLMAVVWSCSKETVEPEYFGSIKGTVIDSETNNGIANVSIETQPATNAILTNKEGAFELADIPTGNYVIEAEKPGYLKKSVNINVREDKISSAVVVMKAEEKENGSQYLQAEITSWNDWSKNDSAYVEVEYKLKNNSSITNINQLEVYFGIYTPGTAFYYEVKDSTLNAGEMSFGSFTRYIQQATVDSVAITGTWTSN